MARLSLLFPLTIVTPRS